jgi:carbamate kinase
VAAGVVVISAGGGGVPVYEDGPRLTGLEGVVDKDLAAAILARDVGASALLILTDVRGVFRAYGTDHADLLSRLRVSEARQMLEAGEFGEGSMGPKVRAAIDFVEASEEGRAVIGALEDAVDALAGKAGTTIVSSPP